MKLPILTLSLILATLLTFGQGAVFNWAQNYTTPIDKIELDSLSNIYSIGSGAITKRTPSGTLLWTRTITNIQALDVTPNGDVYITGCFTGTVNFNSWGAGYPMTSAGNTDIFVSKLNTNGDFVWAQRIGDLGADSATQISLDTLGHIYLTGKFTGSVDFDPGPNTDILSNGTDFFLKLDTAGNYVWGRRLDFSGTDGIYLSDVDGGGIMTCASSNLLGTFDMNPGIGINNIITSAEYVLMQLDENGNFNWAFKIVGIQPNTFSLELLKVDLIGNIYISGKVRGQYDFGGWIPNTSLTTGNQYIVKYNSNGTLNFGKQIMQSGLMGGIKLGGMDVDHSGNIYLSGLYKGGIGFDGMEYGSSGSNQEYSFYTCRLSSNAQFSWVRIYGWFIQQLIGYTTSRISDVSVDNNGCIYNAGFIEYYLNMNFVNASTPPVYIQPNPSGHHIIQKICQSTCTPITTSDTDTVACYKVNNTLVITTSGIYNINYVSSLGCDSIVNTTLTILNPAIDTITISACDSFIYNNQVFFQTGIYPFVTWGPPPPMGCLSGTVLNLTIGIPDTLTMLACDSITIAGVTYNSTGQYNQLINNPNGCDTNLTLNLTINHSQFDTTYATSCINYNFNGITYNTSGVFYQYYVAANLCDSIKVLYLDILQPSSSTIVQTSDCYFTFNGQTYFNSGLHTQTFTNAVGCDSVVYLYLTINPFVANVTQSGTTLTVQNLNVGCQWVDCNNNFAPIPNETNPYFTPSINGSYAVIVSSNGCVDTSNCFVFNGVGFTEYFDDNTIQLYPNPTSNMVTLQSSISMQDATLRIYDMTGALLQEQMNLNGSKFQLNLSSYVNGLYQIEFINQGIRYRSKVRKE